MNFHSFRTLDEAYVYAHHRPEYREAMIRGTSSRLCREAVISFRTMAGDFSTQMFVPGVMSGEGNSLVLDIAMLTAWYASPEDASLNALMHEALGGSECRIWADGRFEIYSELGQPVNFWHSHESWQMQSSDYDLTVTCFMRLLVSALERLGKRPKID